MKAIGFNQPLPISDERSLVDIELPDPEPGPNDLLVAVEAIAVNPVDTKVRASARPAAGSWRVLGWDAVGTVRAVGRDVSGFRVGDRVFHAGAIDRPGCNAQLQVVDGRVPVIADGDVLQGDQHGCGLAGGVRPRARGGSVAGLHGSMAGRPMGRRVRPRI